MISNSIAAAHPQSALLRLRAAAESDQIAIVTALSERVAVVPLLAEKPIGESRLSALTDAQCVA